MAERTAERRMDERPLDPWTECARLPWCGQLAVSESALHRWQCRLAEKVLHSREGASEKFPALQAPSLLLGCSESVLQKLVCYTPLLKRLCALRQSVEGWARDGRATDRHDWLVALHVARRCSAMDPSQESGYCLLPGDLGLAAPCLPGEGLCYRMEGGWLTVSTTAAGLDEDERPRRCFGLVSNDELMLRHGVALEGNPREVYRVEGVRAALLSAGVLSEAEYQRCRESVHEAGDAATFLANAQAQGPRWPGIPGPDVVDLATMVCVRAIVSGFRHDEGLGVNALRMPLRGLGQELRAWECLAALCRREIDSMRPSDPIEVPDAGGEDEQRYFCRVFRREKILLLRSSLEKLNQCIQASTLSLRNGNEDQAAPTSTLVLDAGSSLRTSDVDARGLPPLPRAFLEQAAAMPALVRELIVFNADPSGVDAKALLRCVRLGEDAYSAAKAGLEADGDKVLLSKPGALSSSACEALRSAVDDESRRTTRRDTVDGGPDHQLNMTRQELEGVVGAPAVSSLLRLAAHAEANIPPTLTHDGKRAPRASFFVRRYCGESRPWIPFHQDSVSVTVNVALSTSPPCSVGGDLLAVCGGAVRAIKRTEGEATVHRSGLLHAVTRVTKRGHKRYSLIVFCQFDGAKGAIAVSPPSPPPATETVPLAVKLTAAQRRRAKATLMSPMNLKLVPNFQVSIHRIPRRLRPDIVCVFPVLGKADDAERQNRGDGVVAHGEEGGESRELVAIPTMHRAAFSILERNDVTESERLRIFTRFAHFASTFATLLKKLDPESRSDFADIDGACASGDGGMTIYDEVQSTRALLGYSSLLYCAVQIISHPEWGFQDLAVHTIVAFCRPGDARRVISQMSASYSAELHRMRTGA